MTANRIFQVTIDDKSISPAEAVVRVTVVPEQVTPTTEVRGRLMGPRCPYANTVEVAYPLRPIPSDQHAPPSAQMSRTVLTRQVLIPEASLWEPESPFLYEGPVELWQDGQCCDRVTVRHGLRNINLSPRGLRFNGQLMRLRGKTVSRESDEQALALRREGCNLLVVPVDNETAHHWDQADRLGFLVLGHVTRQDEEVNRLISALRGHASCFGWLLGTLNDSQTMNWLVARAGDSKVGIAMTSPPSKPPDNGVSFLVCPPENQETFKRFGLPLFLSVADPNDPRCEMIVGPID